MYKNFAVAASAFVVSIGVQAIAQTSIVVVATTGYAAPGENGEVFDAVQASRLTPGRDIVFSGQLEVGIGGVTSADAVGVWRYGNGSLSELLRRGLAAPGVPGGTFSSFTGYQETLTGIPGFTGWLTIGTGGVTSSNNSGIWLEDNGELVLQARRADPAAGVVGASYSTLSDFRLSPSGSYSFWGTLLNAGAVTPDNDTALWVNRDGALELVMREGDPIPGLEDGSVGSLFGVGLSPVRADGSFLALGSVNVDIGQQFPEVLKTLWLVTASEGQILVQSGDTAPGTSGGIFKQFVETPTRLENHDIVVRASLETSSVPSGFAGLWRIRNNTTELLIRSDEPAPGSGGMFSGFKRLFSAGNAVVFTASLIGTPDPFFTRDSAWLLLDDEIVQITPSPGALPGVPGALLESIDSVCVNAAGDVVLTASLLQVSGGVVGAGTRGIWAYSSVTGELSFVALEGAQFDTISCRNGSDPRTVSSLQLGTGIGEDGSFTFTAEFSDGSSGAFLHLFQDSPGFCRADFDCSGTVNLGDFGVFGSAFGSSVGDPNFNAGADFDANGQINLGDFGVFGSQFGFGLDDCAP